LNSSPGTAPTQFVAPPTDTTNFPGATSIYAASTSNGTAQQSQKAPVTTVTPTDANAALPNSTQQFYQKTENAKLDKAPTISGASGVKNNAGKATISGTCAAPVSRTWTGGDNKSHTLSAIWINTSSYTTSKGNYWGWIDDTTLASINSSITSCGGTTPIVAAAYDGTKMRTDAAADFRFQPNGPTSPRHELYLKKNVRFSSGIPLESSGKVVGCDTQLPGAQLQFADQSFLRFGENKSWFCDPTTLNANYENQAHACAAPSPLLANWNSLSETEKADAYTKKNDVKFQDFSWNPVDSNGTTHTNSAGNTAFIYMDDENAASVSSYKTSPSSYDNEGSDDAGNLSAAEKRTLAATYVGHVASDSEVASLETGTDSKSKSYREERRKTEAKRSTATQNRDDYKVQTGITDVNFQGSCYAPAGYVRLVQSGYVKVAFNHGAVLKAMSLSIQSLKTGEDLAPLSMQSQNLHSGERQLQLKMYDETHKVNGVRKFIGAVNVAIDDKFGYPNRIGSDYRIQSRVVAPTN
jgi:hypothetical protein